MNTNKNIVATFEDRFGETRKIHATRHGLTVMRLRESNNEKLSKAISGYVGEKVRAIRRGKGLSAEELCFRAGLTFGSNAKQRVYEIEKNKRSIGIRFGTVYQLAIALDVEITELLPSVAEVSSITGAQIVSAGRMQLVV